MEQARTLGLDLCGVAPAEGLDELARLPEWLARGYAGEMRYLHDPRRADPGSVLEGARSLIVCALNYNTPFPYSTEAPIGGRSSSSDRNQQERQGALAPEASNGPRAWISRYAWGDDYHEVLGEKLSTLIAAMHAHFREPFEGRAYVDTGPVVERVAAKYAGLGWLAKNTCFINEQLGSWLFLGTIITTMELTPSLMLDSALGATSLTPSPRPLAPAPDLCGQCTQCIDACPTGAIVEPYVLDARRCISYLTIELRGSIPEELRAPMGRHVFGCDICQDVCPFNRNAPPTSEPRLYPRDVGARHGVPESLLAPSLEFLASLTEDDFRELFRSSAIKRTKWRGLVRNACIALGNVGQVSTPAPARIVALLRRLAESSDAVIAEHAAWALGRVRQ